MKLFLLIVFLISCVLIVTGCTSVAYYAQSSIGHTKLMLARQPISKAMESAEEQGELELFESLKTAQLMRKFAVSELGLPDNKSYTSYVPLKRDSPVYTVVAAEEFSVDAKQWCYPIIGCASYRGYFSRRAAERYAASQQARGSETTVGGAAAYSTLGWFADPLLPSMLRYGEASSAEVLFHELAHQQLYINGDSSFNEAFASVVGEQGTTQWLRTYAPNKLEAYHERLAAAREFSALLISVKNKLASVYASDLSEGDMRDEKALQFEQLHKDYLLLKEQQWSGKPWFDHWFESPLNNARLAAYSTYYDAFDQIHNYLLLCSNNLQRFYTGLAGLSAVDGQVTIPKICKP